MTYPATNSKEASELLIDVSNQMHEIVNEDATTEVMTESGPVPSVRKALADTFLFQDPIAWNQGSDETAFNQLRTFNDSIYWAPTATTLNPIPMGATPIGDSNWKLAPVDVSREWTLQELTRSQNEVIGGKIFPLDDSVLQNGDDISVGTTHLRVEVGGELTIVAMSPVASGSVSNLTDVGATIGGVDVDFYSALTNEFTSVSDMITRAYIGGKCQVNGTYFERVSDSSGDISDFRVIGDFNLSSLMSKDDGSDLYNAIQSAIALGPRTYFVDDSQDWVLSSPIDLPRGMTISARDMSDGWNTVFTYTGSVFPAVQMDSNEQLIGVRVQHGGQAVNGVGIKLGRDTNYESSSTALRCDVVGFSPNVDISNVFYSSIRDSLIRDGAGNGLEINPVSFGSDGGYITTLTLYNSYFSGNAGSGLVDNSPVQAKMLSMQNFIAERNGSPQVKLKSAQVQNMWNFYIEDGTSTKDAVEAQSGYYEHGYVNGSNFGFDFGNGASKAAMKNVVFAGGSTQSNYNVQGGVLSPWHMLEFCQFTNAPTINAEMVVYNGCSGAMPAGVPEYAFVITGNKPKFGVGTNPAIYRNMEAYIETISGGTVPAQGTLVRSISYTGPALNGSASINVTPQSVVPDGLVIQEMKVSGAGYALKILNITATPIVLSDLDCLIEIKNLSSLSQ